jgi:hypothetical protein
MTLDERREVLRMFTGEITIQRAKPGAMTGSAISAEAALRAQDRWWHRCRAAYWPSGQCTSMCV